MLTVPEKIKITKAHSLSHMPIATDIRLENDKIIFILNNSGVLVFPLAAFPRLRDASPEQREAWRLVWGGTAVRWDEIDEDISLRQLLTGED